MGNGTSSIYAIMHCGPLKLPTVFIGLSVSYIVIGLVITFLAEKGSAVIFLNKLHSPNIDFFFRFYTHLGSGWVLLAAALIATLFSYRIVLLVTLIGACQGLVSLITKGILFSEWQRPMAYLKDYDLQLVENVPPLFLRSFPSGHTMTAFGVAMLLSMFNSTRWIQVMLFIYASMIAASRVYLALHFLIDTVVGALLGIMITWVLSHWVFQSSLFKNDLLERKLIIRH